MPDPEAERFIVRSPDAGAGPAAARSKRSRRSSLARVGLALLLFAVIGGFFLIVDLARSRYPGPEGLFVAAILVVFALLLLAPGISQALAVHTLVGMARAPEKEERRRAATGLGQIGPSLSPRYSTTTLSNLVTLSRDPEPAVRWQAVTALGLVLVALRPTERQIALRRAFQLARADADMDVRGAAARTLGLGFASASDELAREAWDALPDMMRQSPEPLASVWLAELSRLSARNIPPSKALTLVLAALLTSPEGTMAWAARKALRSTLPSFPQEAHAPLIEAALAPARGADSERAAETLWDLRSFAEDLSPADAVTAAKGLCAIARASPDPVAGLALLCVGLIGKPQPAATRDEITAVLASIRAPSLTMAGASAALARGLLAPRRPTSPQEVEALSAHANLALERAGDELVEARRWARAAFEVAFMALPADAQPALLRALVALIANPDPRLRTGSSAAIVDSVAHVAPANRAALVDALIALLVSKEEIVQRQTLVTLAGVSQHLSTELVGRVVNAVFLLRSNSGDLVRDEAKDALTVIREKAASKMAA